MNKTKNLLTEIDSRIKQLENKKNNLEWHWTYGPPLAIITSQLEQLYWFKESLESLDEVD